MQILTLEEFHSALKAQGVPTTEDCAFVCPMCGTIQSARDFIAAGAGRDLDEVERFLAFSCVGRFTDAGMPTEGGKEPCNWTLGGLFQTHRLEVVTPDGKHHPRFELASPEEAQKHATAMASARGKTCAIN